ncbi:MAG: hypothetical protein CL853_03635 [Crocinitomicaceae bacterium]|nr:hypothetical protein [Crocinitomicaceae bacterium]|tara:strand:- start:4315 stop:4857 length:543 start_codon:yes stop_codon:yes gene_type:complete
MKAYKFRVVIDIEEDVFRDIVILENQNFEQLHHSIIHAFGFEGDQMASFYMSDEQWEKGEEIGLMDMSFGEESGPLSMKEVQIGSKIENQHQKILYVYDFLRMWIFYLELIDVFEENSDDAYPHVSLNFGESPEESSKDIPDLLDGMTTSSSIEDELNDVFDEFSDDEFGDFENIDDYDL